MTTNKKGAPMGAPKDTAKSDAYDSITVLETVGPCLTKIYKSDGTTDSYDDAASFHYKVVEVPGIHGLSRLLGKLHKYKKRCLIAGAPKGEGMEAGNVEGTVVRKNGNFPDQPLHSFVIDIDGYRPGFADPVLEPEQAVLDFFTDNNLPAFSKASFYWHLSSSAGMPGKEGVLKCHVWVWSKTAYTCAQLTEWAKSVGPAVDRAVYRRVQIRYTADPIFEEGRTDPVPVRCGFHQGETDEVDLVISADQLANARDQGAGEGGNDMPIENLPSEKEGLIGAFNRIYTAEDVLLGFLEGEFEQVTERRYTWHGGGGTPEGVWVHDSGEMIGSSHNTWPITGRANLWDVVRVFKFGDLDQADNAEEDFESLGADRVGSRPSDVAMKAWAAELPELKEVVAQERASELDRLRQIIADSADLYDMEHVAAVAIQAATLSDPERAMVEQLFLARFKALGVPMTRADVRRMLRPRVARENGAPDWVGEWVWVNAENGFRNTRTKQEVSERSFNATYDRSMQIFANDDGSVPKASYMALVEWGVPTVDSMRYAPGEEVTFEVDGIWYGNSFREDVMAKVPNNFSEKDLEAIRVVEEHAAMLILNELERTLFLDYLAHNVQYPGRKIRWAPVLKGVEGDGKSAFITMMAEILGSQNVRELDSSTLEKSDFTGWRTGQCFTGIEEMKLHGHNRYDVFNKIKTSLSNDKVEIHPKGKDPYTVPNTTNYLMLTNFDDGVPINDNDRRCMMLRTPFLTKEALEAELQRRGFADSGDYYKRLFDSIKYHAGALRKWLINRELHPKFEPNGRAPDTEARALAVDLSTREDEGVLDLVLAEGAFGVYENLVDTRSLGLEIERAGGEKPHTARYKSLLASRGFLPYTEGKKNQTRWRDKIRTFYYRGAKPQSAADEAERLEREREAEALERDFAD